MRPGQVDVCVVCGSIEFPARSPKASAIGRQHQSRKASGPDKRMEIKSNGPKGSHRLRSVRVIDLFTLKITPKYVSSPPSREIQQARRGTRGHPRREKVVAGGWFWSVAQAGGRYAP